MHGGSGPLRGRRSHKAWKEKKRTRRRKVTSCYTVDHEGDQNVGSIIYADYLEKKRGWGVTTKRGGLKNIPQLLLFETEKEGGSGVV